jgi:hypothetical protein
MTSVFDSIIDISDAEDALRSQPNLIDNNLIKSIKIKNLDYVSNNFGDNLVLTGSKNKQLILDDEFNMEFSKKTFDLLTYINWNNVVIAGGSIINIITKSADKLNDIDLFVYGLDKENAKKKVDHIINAIKLKASNVNYDTRIYMNKHVINIYVFDTKKLLQVQIILRLYDNLPQILVGFDVDCCCIAWNGYEILSTERGINAIKYRVNVANLSRRSPSYENRLIKYSFRGFDVVTNFKYQNVYNKMFFMFNENHGFTRLLEQELINNGQLKNIIFSNTLRFRQTSSYTSNYASYAKHNLDIKDVNNTESCITKYNANIDDDSMKFKKYTIESIEFMETGVMEQFTGSFHPITNTNWINGTTVDDVEQKQTNTVDNGDNKKLINFSDDSDDDYDDEEYKEYKENNDSEDSKITKNSEESEDDDSENYSKIFGKSRKGNSVKSKKYPNYGVKPVNQKKSQSIASSVTTVTDESKDKEVQILRTDEVVDELGRSNTFINLKYNKYKNISEFENIALCDISNFDAKCLSVMYIANETDIVKIIENKYIPTKNNMYRINPVQIAILLGRTSLAIKLMKNHSWDSVKELIYMMDNDKLFTLYCNAKNISCTEVDNNLVQKYDCENISNNIHNQSKGDKSLDDFYALEPLEMFLKLQFEPEFYNSSNKLDINKLPYEVIKFLSDRGKFTKGYLDSLIKKRINPDNYEKTKLIVNDDLDMRIINYVIETFEEAESKRSDETSNNIIKLYTLYNTWDEKIAFVDVFTLMQSVNLIPNLYTCMRHIYNPKLTLEIIQKLLPSSWNFDKLVNYVIYLDDIDLIQKLIPKDDIYVKLKYHYKIDTEKTTKIAEFLQKIDKDRQNDKIKTNKILKNTDFHIEAITDGELKEGYTRCENVFGITPDDNIVAKLLLMYNKIFNKSESMSDKDKTTLKNMRKSVGFIRRNDEFNMVDKDYFYSIELHNLFFEKDN